MFVEVDGTFVESSETEEVGLAYYEGMEASYSCGGVAGLPSFPPETKIIH